METFENTLWKHCFCTAFNVNSLLSEIALFSRIKAGLTPTTAITAGVAVEAEAKGATVTTGPVVMTGGPGT